MPASYKERTMKTVKIIKRSNDYQAYLANDNRFWGAGKTPNGAIGELVNSHPEQFDIALEFTGMPFIDEVAK
jgi:hypothetical protein